MKLSDVAEKLSCRLEGDPSAEITGIAGMDHATPGQITFLANRRYFPLLHTTRATAIFIEDGIRIERDPGLPPLAALRSSNPYLRKCRTPWVSKCRFRVAWVSLTSSRFWWNQSSATRC